MPQAKIGVIGGTGLYDVEGLTDIEEVNINTPFGKPSGVEQVIAINSVGSFKDELKPGDLVIPDQLIDRTRSRVNSFFGDGIVAHIPFAEPFCPALSQTLSQATKVVGATVHPEGTYVVMEGPAFSTRAESRLYRSWGADIIGMTALPEAKLAKEAEMCYAIIACVTDYDSWKELSEPITVDVILDTLRQNIDTAKRIIKLAVGRIPETHQCECATALKTAIVTAPELMPADQKRKLNLLIGKYLKGES
jgi:5'-methylthioadenosine phosphorylase